uniref:separase n=1 Tax=Catharus ustulatus TaxID=91951 RepID=A0A8C3U3P9_CATUS
MPLKDLIPLEGLSSDPSPLFPQESLRSRSSPPSRRVQHCDRALRTCVEQLALPGGLLAQGCQLLTLAQEATHTYLSLVPDPPHLYLEKILFHVLRNAAGWLGPHAWSAAELLRARLRRCPRRGDWAAVTRGAFSVLWRAAPSLAGPERPREEGRAVLTARMRALQFLLLLECQDGESRESFQPPFFTSHTAQHAAAAAALYEAQRAPCPLFLARQLRELLLDTLQGEAPHLQHSLCHLELTLERCRHLCKARRHRDALDALEDSRRFSGAGNSLGAPLEVLEAGIQLSRAVAKGGAGVQGVGPALCRAGAALRAECSGRILRVLLECSQFVLAQLGEVLRRSQELPLGFQELPGVWGSGSFSRWMWGWNLGQEGPGVSPEALVSPQPSEWPELAQVTTSCVRSVTWMLEGLEGLPEAEGGKFLDVTGQCHSLCPQCHPLSPSPVTTVVSATPCVPSGQCHPLSPSPVVSATPLHRCFRLQVESWRCRGRHGRAMDAVAQWLLPSLGSLVAEPVALWARIKVEAAKQGEEELRLRTLRDALESQSQSQSLPGDALVALLLAELQAYKSLRGPTASERYSVLCDLLELGDTLGMGERLGEPGRSLARAVALLELAQLLCSHSFSPHTDCSALDAIQESLVLLESLSHNSQAQNSQIQARLLDERAQALLWLHICTLEALVEKVRDFPGIWGVWGKSWGSLGVPNPSQGDFPGILGNPGDPRISQTLPRVEQGVSLLLQALGDPQSLRATRGWFLARAQGLQLVAAFLELPPARLKAPLRELIQRQGWSTPQVALLEAQKLLRSVLVSLMGSDVLGSARSLIPSFPLLSPGPALVHKWQVLGDTLSCCQRLVTLLGHCEVLCRARAFCSEGLTLAGHLQAARWCSWFLVLQAQLELQQGELELSQSHLQHAQFLLQPGTGEHWEGEIPRHPRRRAPIHLQKGFMARRIPQDPRPDPKADPKAPNPTEEDEQFLQGPELAQLPPAALPEPPDALTASPQLRPSRKKILEFFSHPTNCGCSFCSDPALLALGLRWLLGQARVWLLAGEVAPGVALVRGVLARCDSAGTRLEREVALSPPGPLAELVAAAFSTLAQQSLPSPSQSSPVWDQELERGLTLLGSQSPPVAGLGVAMATLLLAKAVSTLSHVATTLGRSMDDILAQAWTPKPQKPQKSPKAPPKTHKAPKTKTTKTPKVKPPKFGDVFTLGDSESEVPPIVLRPGGVCTPHPKSGVAPKSLLGLRTPFTIFSEEPSPPGGGSRIRRAPKIPARVKSRIRVSLEDLGRGIWGGVPSLQAVLSLLRQALAWLCHCPPGSLYAQLCQLLALALGDRDRVATAGLLAESLSVTTRHQLLAMVHGDISDQLQGLSLQDSQNSQNPQEDSQHSQHSQSHLAQLQELFQFSSSGLGPEQREKFQEQLQRIPSGVTVCQLSLVSATPGAVGDTLLLTRLERGSEPLSVRIATERGQAPLSGILREFEQIQREQREANACTERREWWERRSRLDQRMQSLIQSLDSEVLGCWRGLLLPQDPQSSPLEEQELSQLLQELRECGWDSPEPALLRAVLPALSPAAVPSLAVALCPARPLRARLLLDEALERRRERPGGGTGTLVLLLDRHLQRLPWESTGTLRNVPVTRLPGLRFLLSYGLGQQGSVLQRGVDPSRAFYVLNPQRDLGGTEQRFRAWFESFRADLGYFGCSYAGHGAGARLLDGLSLSRLRCRAVSLLFGCSSAALAPRGGLEPTGTVLKFILAGCPLVLGNLWDVTDRDLDRLAEALLRGWLGGGPGTPLLAQLAQARQAPRLKSLIGAAPVAYGLPVSLC